MAQPHEHPEVACYDDYDSDESAVKPGTRTFARSAASSNQSGHQLSTQSHRGRDRSNTALPTSTPVAPPASRRSSTPAARTNQNADRVRRTESQTRRVQIQAPPPLSRSNSVSFCRNPNCREPGCTAAQTSRPYSVAPQQPQYSRPPPIPPQIAQQIQFAPYGYGPQPRPRVNSISQQRPVSWSAPIDTPIYSPHYNPQPAQHGPPPSRSAYHRVYAAQTPATSQIPTQPMYAQPPDPMRVAMAGLSIGRPQSTTTYSARTVPSEYTSPALKHHIPLTRTSSLSARRPSLSRTIVPGAYTGDSIQDDAYHHSDDDDDPDFERERSRSKRDSKLMPPPSRPSVRPTQTTPNFSTRSFRESSQRAPTSDTGVDYVRDELADPDRTPRPSTTRRHSSTHSSSRSRRPSASTASSSARSKATTISSGSGSARQTQDDRDARRRERVTQDHYAEQQADAMAYQQKLRGPQPAELTAENIRQMDDRRKPRTRSGASGHSRKSGQSGSQSDGVRFKYGQQNYDFPSKTQVEFRLDVDGKPAQFIVTPGPATSATESKSSSSRVGRSTAASDHGSVP